MANKIEDPRNIYELMENSEGEVMALIFADDTVPQNSTFWLDEEACLLELTRAKDNIVLIEGLQKESIEKLKKLDKLYVCEIKYNENKDEENEILYAYAATLKKKEKNPQQQNPQIRQPPQGNISEKARKAREELLKKMQKK